MMEPIPIPLATFSETLRRVLDNLIENIVSAAPNLIVGLIFLGIAYVGVKVILRVTSSTLKKTYPEDQQLIAKLIVTVTGIFLWFGVVLTFLKVVGMGDIATSIGTATGFIALGVAYALSNMIEDTVAGVYLLRDPDFNPGDEVTTESTTGTLKSIGLRKSRIQLDNGDIAVLSNRAVEDKWTRKTTSEKPAE